MCGRTGGGGGGGTHAGGVHDRVDAFDGVVEHAGEAQVAHVGDLELVAVRGAVGEHALGLLEGAGGAADAEAAAEEGVEDVGADEARRTGEQHGPSVGGGTVSKGTLTASGQ